MPCNTALTACVVVVALKLARRAWRIINPVVRTKMFRMGQSTLGNKLTMIVSNSKMDRNSSNIMELNMLSFSQLTIRYRCIFVE